MLAKAALAFLPQNVVQICNSYSVQNNIYFLPLACEKRLPQI